MKFNDINQEQWLELRPYLDTCLLPISGLTGSEDPTEVVLKLAELRNIMDHVEIPFTGRIVTYPAVQYIYESSTFSSSVEQICANLKAGGFKYVIVITADPIVAQKEFNVDLFITPRQTSSDNIAITESIQALWNS